MNRPSLNDCAARLVEFLFVIGFLVGTGAFASAEAILGALQ